MSDARRATAAVVLFLFLLRFAAAGPVRAGNPPPVAIDGHRTVDGAVVSDRPDPVPVAHAYGPGRDWRADPFRLAVILVDFADVRHRDGHDAAFYRRLFLGGDGPASGPATRPAAGSLADWYAAQSDGRFGIRGRVFDWVAVEPTYAAVHGMVRKEAEQKYLRAAADAVRRRDGRAALDGYDAWFIIHAGPIAGPSNNVLWSHRWTLDGTRYLTTYETDTFAVSCHEFGHVLGLPDLYGKPGDRQGVGAWCTMSTGYRGPHPGSLCVWSKARLGWCTPTVIDAGRPQSLVLRPIQLFPQDAFLIPLNGHDGAGAEFLLLENRGAVRDDVGRDAGLLIWRVTRVADQFGQPAFTLALPGPDDGRPATRPDGRHELLGSPATAPVRRACWPSAADHEYRLPAAGDRAGVSIGNVRRVGPDVEFDVAAN